MLHFTGNRQIIKKTRNKKTKKNKKQNKNIGKNNKQNKKQ
jgi:hypothetical protein